MKAALEDVLHHKRLTPLFQPIVDLKTYRTIGYEALIRGPVHSHLYSPLVLFNLAKKYGLDQQLEQLCCQVQVEKFHRLGLQGLLFLNMSPDLFVGLSKLDQEQQPWFEASYVVPQHATIVIELSEQKMTRDYEQLRLAAQRCRRLGMQFAIDDLGEGYASLRLWSELQPEFVKLDRYFAHHLHRHPFKQQLLKAIADLAEINYTKVVAEGIEQQVELEAIQAIGISHGQGYYFGHPVANPIEDLPWLTITR